MKKYWLFAGMQYYPRGGMNDFVDSFDHLLVAGEEGAKRTEEPYTWAHVIDSETGNVCARYGVDRA